MIIAASVNERSLSAVIPERFEEAGGLLVVDTDTGGILDFSENDRVETLKQWDCEVLLCGQMYDSGLFDKIAINSITRNLASGLSVENAIKEMLLYKLENISDYVGGPGCGGENHSHDCDGDCSNCAANEI